MENKKYPELHGKCLTCLGCNRLDLKDFKGVYRCDSYVEGEKNDRLEKKILYCISTINIYSCNLEHTDTSISIKNRAKRR